MESRGPSERNRLRVLAVAVALGLLLLVALRGLRLMRRLAVPVGALVLSALLLVSGYLWLTRNNLIIQSLDRGALDKNGVMMATYCGSGSGNKMLDKIPPDGSSGVWTKGRTIRGNCDIWYHHTSRYQRCGTSEVTFDEPRPC